MEHLRVSPRHLGKMRMKDFCEACYVTSIGIGFKPPYGFPMAGLLHNMDRFEKRLVDAHFAKTGSLPKWLDSLGCSEPIAVPWKMTKDYADYGLTLVGILRRQR